MFFDWNASETHQELVQHVQWAGGVEARERHQLQWEVGHSIRDDELVENVLF